MSLRMCWFDSSRGHNTSCPGFFFVKNPGFFLSGGVGACAPRRNNGNADDTDNADGRGFFPDVGWMATRMMRITRIDADFSRRSVEGNADDAD